MNELDEYVKRVNERIDKLEQENAKLKDENEKISKAIDHINETGMICACGQDSYEKLQNDILNILENNKED